MFDFFISFDGKDRSLSAVLGYVPDFRQISGAKVLLKRFVAKVYLSRMIQGVLTIRGALLMIHDGIFVFFPPGEVRITDHTQYRIRFLWCSFLIKPASAILRGVFLE